MSNVYDVIVIGLGAMGSAALYQSAKAGANVLGIDQAHPPHTLGSTHGESRITRLATGEGSAYVPFAQRSHELWREIEAASGAQLLTLSGGLILCPKGETAHFHGQQDFVAHSAAIADAHGIAHSVMSDAAVRERWPNLRMQPHEHAYFEPTGGIVAVEEAVATQLSLAQRHGATVRLGEKVTALQPDATGVTVTTASARLRAAKVILATGSWIAELLAFDGSPTKLPATFAIYRQVFYWFEAEDSTDFHADRFPFLIWIGERQEEFFSAFPHTAGGTVGLKVVTEEYLSTTSPDAVDRVVHPDEVERMYNEFVTRRVSGVRPRLLKSAVCLYTNTADEHFVLDHHPASEHLLVASPCSGHGFKHSAAIGETLAQLALTGKSELSIEPFAFARFQ